MTKKSLTRMVAVAAATLLLLAACGSDDDADSSSAATTAAPATTEAASVNMTPGEGVSVTVGRASWSTGYVQAEIYTALMRELGYTCLLYTSPSPRDS